MPFAVRLEGLPPLAESVHIRQFFTGLEIPSGGVNIIGGEKGEAYVDFKTFEDSLYSLKKSGMPLLNSCIKVSLERQVRQTYKNHCDESKRTESSYRPFKEKPGYLRISLHPFDATFSDVKRFFKKYSVKSVIFLTKNKVRNGQALVKFAHRQHACQALAEYRHLTIKPPKHGKAYVVGVKNSDTAEWIKFGGRVHLSDEPQRNSYGYYAHLTNVSRRAEKHHIKRFLFNLVDNSHIIFLYDKNGFRKQDCFVRFVTENDYIRALNLDKSVLKGRAVRVSPISQAQVSKVINHSKMDITYDSVSKEDSMSTEVLVSEEDFPSQSSSGSKVTCVYVRNFAADVKKRDILNFFPGFSLTEDDIYLLYHDSGNGLGEALVRFSSEEKAASAEQLNCKLYKGTEIFLRCISEEQVKAFGVHHFGSSSCDSVDLSTDKEECSQEEPCVSVADDAPDDSDSS